MPDEVRGRLSAAVGLCTETVEDTRALSRMLRPQILDDLGIEAALAWLARSVAESTGLEIEVEAVALAEPLDSDLATLVFRVAQEALGNVAKHAPWIVPETKRLIENLDFPMMFLGTNFTDPYRRTNPLVVSMAKLYAPVARYRVRNLDVRLPVESKLAKALGLFARQD